MIKKVCEESIMLRKHIALAKRLPENHPLKEKIERDLKNLRAGFNGEKSVGFELNYLDREKYLIFHDLRLQGENDLYFQMDILLISEKFILILEVKNIAGLLKFDQEKEQFTRFFNDKEEGFTYPIVQVKKQQQQLFKWLQKNKFPSIPIYSYVVLSNPSTIFNTSTNTPITHLLHAASISLKIEEIDAQINQATLTKRELKKLTTLLLKNNTPHDTNILSKYELKKEDIQLGIQCSSCKLFKITRIKGKWTCENCKYRSLNAHKVALEEYFFLFGPVITNKQLRNFLNIHSSSVASKIFAKTEFQSTGSFKNRKYFIDLKKMKT